MSEQPRATQIWPTEVVELAPGSADPTVESTAVFYQRGEELPAGWTSVEARRRLKVWRRIAAFAVVCTLGVLVLLLVRDRQPDAVVEPLQQRIVVAPFRTGGADASLHFLREGMVELLSTRLAEGTNARAVDAGAVLRAWRRAGIHRSQDASNDTVVRLAARLGAERVIVGSVVGTPSRAVMSAAVIAAESGEISGEATVEGPADSLTVLVDRLAGQLLATQAGHDQPLSSFTTKSLPALRFFLSASSAFAAGDYRVAADRYDRALRSDPSFALAAFRLGLASRRMADFALERKALAQAWQFRETLNEQDRTHLLAWAGPQYPDASTRSAAIAAWEAAARAAPERADVWYEYAAVLGNSGQALAPLDRERVVDALERAIELDPAYAPPRLMLFQLTGRMVPDERLDSLLDVQRAVIAPVLLWRLAVSSADSVRLRQIADTLSNLGPANLRLLAAAAQFDAVPGDDGYRALRVLSSRAPSAEQANDFLVAEHSFALNHGQPERAIAVSRRMQRLSPATRSHLRLRVLDAVFADGDTSIARQAAAELERSAQNAASLSTVADACALGLWALARRDTMAARGALQIMRVGERVEPMTLNVSGQVCARLTEAALAVEAGALDARRRVLQLDSLVLTAPAAGDVATFGHLVMARLHRRLGQPELALQAIRRRPYMAAAWPRYLSETLREEGQLAELVGDRPGAISAYERYLSLRRDADSIGNARVADVAAALRALQSHQPQ